MKSHVSRVTNKTRATDKGTEYPPLPMSVQGETNIWSPTSQTSKLPKTSRAPSKAPSVSPSDSPSQVKYKSPPKSPAPKLRSIPSESGGESPKRGNGHGENHSLELTKAPLTHLRLQSLPIKVDHSLPTGMQLPQKTCLPLSPITYP